MIITGVILARNEQDNIKRSLDSLSFCDEVIVIDDYSEDKTSEIAKKLGAKVYKRKLKGDFARQRNFALKKAKGNWVLYVDADERVSKALAFEISNVKYSISNEIQGFYILRRDFVWGRKLKFGETGSMKLLRFGRKDAGIWKRKVHEHWKINGNVGVLKNPLYHYPHPSVSKFVRKINIYANLHAKENDAEAKSAGILKTIFYPIVKFCRNYVIKLGFLDGTGGFVVSIMMSFHSFLSWSTLWLSKRKV